MERKAKFNHRKIWFNYEGKNGSRGFNENYESKKLGKNDEEFIKIFIKIVL